MVRAASVLAPRLFAVVRVLRAGVPDPANIGARLGAKLSMLHRRDNPKLFAAVLACFMPTAAIVRVVLASEVLAAPLTSALIRTELRRFRSGRDDLEESTATETLDV